MHPADECLILFEHAVIAARGEIEPQFFLADDRTQSGVFEVLVQRIDLTQRLRSERG